MNLLGLRARRARGLSVGVAARGIGRARAFAVNETAGTYAGVGLALKALLISLIGPVPVFWLA